MTDPGATGLSRVQFWLLTLMGLTALAVVIVNIFTMMNNAELRSEVNQRQQFINQSIKLGRLHNQLIQGLAQLSARTDDEQLRQLLAKHGINFTVSAKPTQKPAQQVPIAVEGGAQ